MCPGNGIFDPLVLLCVLPEEASCQRKSAKNRTYLPQKSMKTRASMNVRCCEGKTHENSYLVR